MESWSGDEILTIQEVAGLLKLHPMSVRRLTKVKAPKVALPHHKIGIRFRFLRSEVINWLQAGGASQRVKGSNEWASESAAASGTTTFPAVSAPRALALSEVQRQPTAPAPNKGTTS